MLKQIHNIMQTKDLINWKNVSKVLAGNDNSVRKDSIPKKYLSRIDYLLQLLEIWERDENVWTKKEIQEWLNKLEFTE